VSFSYVCLAHFSFLWDLPDYALSNSPNNHNKWYQSRRFASTWWWPAHTMGSVEEGLRVDGSHRPDGDRLIWWGLSLEGEIVRNPSVSLSPTLNKNEKVKQYIRKKTHKPTALRFWVKSGIIPLCMFGPFLLLVRSPRLSEAWGSLLKHKCQYLMHKNKQQLIHFFKCMTLIHFSKCVTWIPSFRSVYLIQPIDPAREYCN